MTVAITRDRFFFHQFLREFCYGSLFPPFARHYQKMKSLHNPVFFNRNHTILDTNLYSSHLMLKPYFKILPNFFLHAYLHIIFPSLNGELLLQK